MPPNDMPPAPPMPMDGGDAPEGAMPEPPMEEEPKEDKSEIDGIFNKLDTEKQAAVIKYAKSMVNDTDDEEDSDGDAGMPEPPMEDEAPDGMTESKKGLNDLVNEIVNNILSDMETSDDEARRDTKIRNRKISTDTPYVSNR